MKGWPWRQVLLALGLVGSGYLALFGDKTPVQTDAATTAAGPAQSTHRAALQAGQAPAAAISTPAAPHKSFAWAPRAMQLDPDVAPPDPFAWPSPPPSPAPEKKPEAPSRPLSAPPPSNQPTLPAAVSPLAEASFPYTVLGKQREPDGPWRVFLARQGQVFVVQTGDLLEGRYRVERIEPPELALRQTGASQERHVLAIGDPL